VTGTLAVPAALRASLPGRQEVLPLSLEGLCLVAGGRRLIDHIDLRLHAGPPTLIMGANGAGKTLLLRLCHGLLRPTSGRVAWCGPDPESIQRAQAMVFQRPVLLRRSVAANIHYPLRMRGVARSARRDIVAEALRTAGLEALAHRPARVLSAGEQQRLALARAWSLQPQVLFLDEPTANLDPAATRAVEEMVHAIGSQGTKIIMTTHDLGQARRLAGEVCFLYRGRLVEHAPAADFFDARGSEEARAFLEGRLLF
jgi:tungstate transport system ATP-binding protein